MKNKKIIIILVALLLVSIVGMVVVDKLANNNTSSENNGGVLLLRVNPEIAISYDDKGLVTKIEARNDDAKVIIDNYKDFKGKECRTVISELVNDIGEAGYLVEEVEGENKQITIEIEKGSNLPNDKFLDDIVGDVRQEVSDNKWRKPVVVEGESDYGITDYVDTDYGVGNDGDSNYDDTDYGTGNDGVTDYDDNSSNYNDSNYSSGSSNNNSSTSKPSASKPSNNGNSNYDDGNSNYDDNNSNYGSSSYDDNDSGYDD